MTIFSSIDKIFLLILVLFACTSRASDHTGELAVDGAGDNGEHVLVDQQIVDVTPMVGSAFQSEPDAGSPPRQRMRAPHVDETSPASSADAASPPRAIASSAGRGTASREAVHASSGGMTIPATASTANSSIKLKASKGRPLHQIEGHGQLLRHLQEEALKLKAAKKTRRNREKKLNKRAREHAAQHAPEDMQHAPEDMQHAPEDMQAFLSDQSPSAAPPCSANSRCLRNTAAQLTDTRVDAETRDTLSNVFPLRLSNGGELPLRLSHAPRRLDIEAITAGYTAFAALTFCGRVVTWGDPESGGDSSLVQHHLIGVQSISTTGRAFAALRSDGRVVIWGDLYHPSGVFPAGVVQSGGEDLVGVEAIAANNIGFAAIKPDGCVYFWGGRPVSPKRRKGRGDNYVFLESDHIIGVQGIAKTCRAFAAHKLDGSVVAWGDPNVGGYVSGDWIGLGVQSISSTTTGFIADQSDSSCAFWGCAFWGARPGWAETSDGDCYPMGSEFHWFLEWARTSIHGRCVFETRERCRNRSDVL